MSGRRRLAPRGYLLVLVAVCVSILSISFLRLAASSAQKDDVAEEQLGVYAAYYGAESGIVEADLKLASLTAAPPSGPWFSGTLALSKARYTVEVVSVDPKAKQVVLRSIGRVEGEGGKVLSAFLEATAVQGGDKRWSIQSWKRL